MTRLFTWPSLRWKGEMTLCIGFKTLQRKSSKEERKGFTRVQSRRQRARPAFSALSRHTGGQAAAASGSPKLRGSGRRARSSDQWPSAPG